MLFQHWWTHHWRNVFFKAYSAPNKPHCGSTVLVVYSATVCTVLYACIVLGGLKSKGLTLLKCRCYKSLPCVETNYPRTIDARRYSYGCQSPNSSSRPALFGASPSLKPTGPDTNTLHEGHFKVQNSLNFYPPVESKPQYNIKCFLSLRLKSVSFRGNNKV